MVLKGDGYNVLVLAGCGGPEKNLIQNTTLR